MPKELDVQVSDTTWPRNDSTVQSHISIKHFPTLFIYHALITQNGYIIPQIHFNLF